MKAIKTAPVAWMVLLAASVVGAQIVSASNISPVNKWSWGENIGWTNWFDNNVTSGATVGNYVLSGFIWSENIGWLYLGSGVPAIGNYYGNAAAGDTGVNIAANGDLDGYAWGENIGWVNFKTPIAAPNQAHVDMCCSTASFRGYAWGENVGWINLASAPFAFVGLGPGVATSKGDLDGDTLRNGNDIQGFVNTLFSPGTAAPRSFCAADMNGDGSVTVADVAPFITCLLTGSCVCP